MLTLFISAAAAAEHGAAHAESAPGMPQLDPSSYSNQIFWLVVTLAVIYLLLTRIALPRISAVLAERQGTITNDLARAEDLKRQAEEAEAAYEKAMADARAEAQMIIANNKAEMQAELDRAMAEADARIAEQTAESEKSIAEIRDGALESARAVAKDTAGALVAALGGTATQAEIDAAVDQELKG